MKKEIQIGWSIASLVCGILSMILFFMPYITIPLAILGIVFGCKNKDGMSIGGLVTSIIGITIGIFMLLILFLYMLGSM